MRRMIGFVFLHRLAKLKQKTQAATLEQSHRRPDSCSCQAASSAVPAANPHATVMRPDRMTSRIYTSNVLAAFPAQLSSTRLRTGGDANLSSRLQRHE
jgi:hypothetical protein